MKRMVVFDGVAAIIVKNSEAESAILQSIREKTRDLFGKDVTGLDAGICSAGYQNRKG